MPQCEIAFSNLNFAPVKAVTTGSEQLREFLHETGYDDAEVSPTRRLVRELGRMARKGGFENTKDGQRLIGSVHQPPSQGIPRALRSGSLANIKAAVAMPEVHGALEPMAMLQELAGVAIPAVLYPDYRVDGELVTFDGDNAPFAHRLTQIYPEFYGDCGVWSGGEVGDDASLWAALERSGLTGVCLDGFHIRRLGKRPPLDGQLLDWQEVLRDIRYMRIPVPEFHFAVGRTDSSGWDPRMHAITLDEYDAARRGPEAIGRTEIGDILLQTRAIHAASALAHQAFRVVAELPSSVVGGKDFVKIHTEIAAHLRQLLQAQK